MKQARADACKGKATVNCADDCPLYTVPGRDWPSESVAQQPEANRQPFDSDSESDERTVPL